MEIDLTDITNVVTEIYHNKSLKHIESVYEFLDECITHIKTNNIVKSTLLIQKIRNGNKVSNLNTTVVIEEDLQNNIKLIEFNKLMKMYNEIKIFNTDEYNIENTILLYIILFIFIDDSNCDKHIIEKNKIVLDVLYIPMKGLNMELFYEYIYDKITFTELLETIHIL